MWQTSGVPFTLISFSSNSKSDTVSFGVVFICHKRSILLSVGMTIRFNKNHATVGATVLSIVVFLAVFDPCSLFIVNVTQTTGKFLP